MALMFGALASPATAQLHDGDLYAVYFRADFCGNCRVLDPELAAARAASRDLPVRHLTLDLDAPAEDYDAVMFAMLDRGLADLYNAYLGLTGVVFLIAPDTGLPVDCLTRQDNADRIVLRLEHALGVVRSQGPQAREPVIGSICPAPMRALPQGRVYGE